jgi:putative DNA primase/helicase
MHGNGARHQRDAQAIWDEFIKVPGREDDEQKAEAFRTAVREHAALEGAHLNGYQEVQRAANLAGAGLWNTDNILAWELDAAAANRRAARREAKRNNVTPIGDAKKRATTGTKPKQQPTPPKQGDWMKLLRFDPENKLKPTMSNVALILTHDNAWRGKIAHNSFTHRDCLVSEPPWRPEYKGAAAFVVGQAWADVDDDRVVMWFAHEYKIQIKAADAAAAVRVAAGANSINPPLDYYEALVWDGLPRAGKWLTTYMGCEDTAYNNHVGRWWLISGVARSYQPGCQVDHTLILEGKQGRGKSQALRALAGDGWFTDDLEDFTKKDAVQQLCGKKIVELSELDNLRKADVAEIKAFLTRQVDDIRLPYARHPVPMPRQCVFAGSTNNAKYFRDETGNRRFWPVKCIGKIDRHGLARDRDQLWAEAVHLYKTGSKWHPEDPVMLSEIERQQEDRREELPWENIIRAYVERRKPDELISTDEILTGPLDKKTPTWNQQDTRAVGACMRSLGYEPTRKRREDGSQERGWWKRSES